ncbi:hypothetical protein [Nocardia sp. NPDC058633]|uniref:hypothetical protein n=1 Tax=Nocardia sp. NPDC058633 TaxID=3346568 RepID=UPI003659A734
MGELQARAQRGETPAEVGAWLVQELGAVQEIQLVSYMFQAFEISLKALKGAYDWVGLGHGGAMTDDELNQLIGPLVVRSGDRELVQHPDGSRTA